MSKPRPLTGRMLALAALIPAGLTPFVMDGSTSTPLGRALFPAMFLGVIVSAGGALILRSLACFLASLVALGVLGIILMGVGRNIDECQDAALRKVAGTSSQWGGSLSVRMNYLTGTMTCSIDDGPEATVGMDEMVPVW